MVGQCSPGCIRAIWGLQGLSILGYRLYQPISPRLEALTYSMRLNPPQSALLVSGISGRDFLARVVWLGIGII